MYAPFKKPNRDTSAVAWNECIASLRTAISTRMLRPCVCKEVDSLRMHAGLDLARAIVYLKSQHENSGVNGTCKLAKRAFEHFIGLDLVVGAMRLSGDSFARAFQKPSLTLGEVCFFLSSGARPDVLCIGRPLSPGVISVQCC